MYLQRAHSAEAVAVSAAGTTGAVEHSGKVGQKLGLYSSTRTSHCCLRLF